MDKIVLITGGSRGIGAAAALLAAQRGWAVAINYLRHAEAANGVVRQIEAAGGRAIAVQADVAVEADVVTLFETVDHRLGRLTALVNNAASLLGPSFDEASPEQFDAYFALNVKAPFFLAQQLCRRMVDVGGVVNISSASAHFSSPGDIVYAMSKAALESLTRNMAEHLLNLNLLGVHEECIRDFHWTEFLTLTTIDT